MTHDQMTHGQTSESHTTKGQTSPARIHRAVSDDGVEIAGRIYGQGPPVVLVHGAAADGESEWGQLLPLLTERFTCYVPSARGRGLSGAHPEHSRDANVRDITAFVDSIGEPVALVGVSSGGMTALGVAARSAAVSALMVREPVVFEVLGGSEAATYADLVEFVGQELEQDRVASAAEAFLRFVSNDEEFAVLSEDDEGLDQLAEYLPLDEQEFREALAFDGPSPTDPATLRRITAPTLVLHGPQTGRSWFTDSVRFVAEHVPNAVVHEIPDTGHLGHLVAPARDAQVLVPLLEGALQPM